jgi:hypothetical protein
MVASGRLDARARGHVARECGLSRLRDHPGRGEARSAAQRPCCQRSAVGSPARVDGAATVLGDEPECPTDERHGAHVHHACAEIARPAHNDNDNRADTRSPRADADDRLKSLNKQAPGQCISSQAEIQLITVDLQQPPDHGRHLGRSGSTGAGSLIGDHSGLRQHCATGRPRSSPAWNERQWPSFTGQEPRRIQGVRSHQRRVGGSPGSRTARPAGRRRAPPARS